jgi:hypothetical protein
MTEPDLLRIEVVDDEIVVTLPNSQLSVTYYMSDEFLAKAWKLANDKARELGWVG